MRKALSAARKRFWRDMTADERKAFVERRAELARSGLAASKQKPTPIPRKDLLLKVFG